LKRKGHAVVAPHSTELPVVCPKFQTCNAALCPVDPHWREAVHLRGEPVCPY